MLDLLLPQRCVVCRAGGPQLCEPCLARLERIVPPLCERCGAPTAYPVRRCRECSGRRLAFATARAAVEYDAGARAIIRAWKERNLRRLADAAAAVVADAVALPAADAVTFVPPDRGRLLERGHHPAETLARGLGERWTLPVEPLLRRVRASDPQRGLSLADRRRNVARAFEARSRVPPCVLLVDDVYTTGSTATAAATALRKAGARHVDVVTFARAIRFD